MTGKDRAREALKALIESMLPAPQIQRGPVLEVFSTGLSFQVTVDLGYRLVVGPEGMSSTFLGELRAAAQTSTGLPSMIGRKVEVHFSEGRQASIAYTVGV
jgi:hypothetical protein